MLRLTIDCEVKVESEMYHNFEQMDLPFIWTLRSCLDLFCFPCSGLDFSIRQVGCIDSESVK